MKKLWDLFRGKSSAGQGRHKESTSGLDFFNRISGTLEIELSEPAKPVGNLLNVAASPDAEICSIKLRPYFIEEDADDGRDLTPDELALVVIPQPTIRLRGEGGSVVEHQAPNREHFTVADLLQAIEETERRTRGESEWLGGVDVHHIYFEGIAKDSDGSWMILWGS